MPGVHRATSLVVQQPRLCTPNAWGPGSTPAQGIKSHMPQLRVRMLRVKIGRAKTKTQHNQINKYFFKKESIRGCCWGFQGDTISSEQYLLLETSLCFISGGKVLPCPERERERERGPEKRGGFSLDPGGGETEQDTTGAPGHGSLSMSPVPCL